MAHTVTGMLALATVLLILLARRCEGSARHRGCARHQVTTPGTVPRGTDAPMHHDTAPAPPATVSAAGRPG